MQKQASAYVCKPHQRRALQTQLTSSYLTTLSAKCATCMKSRTALRQASCNRPWFPVRAFYTTHVHACSTSFVTMQPQNSCLCQVAGRTVVYVYTHVNMYRCSLCGYIYIYTCIYIYIRIGVSVLRMYVYICNRYLSYIFIFIYIYTLYAYMYIYIYMHMYAYECKHSAEPQPRYGSQKPSQKNSSWPLRQSSLAPRKMPKRGPSTSGGGSVCFWQGWHKHKLT